MSWAPSHDAPRDRPVWLFLPASSFKTDAQGRPYDVAHECVRAAWDARQNVWKVVGSDRQVFPSLWSDAPIDGVMPDNPLLGIA